MTKLLIFPAVNDERLARIESVAEDLTVVNSPEEQAALREVTDADAFFGKLTPALLAKAQRLRWVQSPTASLEHYLFPELVEHPCVLTNMRGLFSDVIADHVMGYVLCFARNLHRYIRLQLEGRWAPVGGETARTSFAVGPGVVSDMDRTHIHLSDCTLGIVGFGAIGKEIARRALCFGLRVIAVDPAASQNVPGVEALWPMDQMGRLLGESDFVVIAAPHTPKTAGMFDRATLRQMKRTAYLINIGRGVIVRLDDLCDALDAGELAGAALDVFEIEPLPADHRLWKYENVILTPHVAACSVRIAERHLEVLLDNIRRFVRGEPLRNVASKTEWY